MFHVKGFPPKARESIQMLAQYSDAFVVLSTSKSGSLESIMASPSEGGTFPDEELLERMIEKMSLKAPQGSGWLVFPDDELEGRFLEGRYAEVDTGPLGGNSFLWLFRTKKNPWASHCLFLMEQTRQALENFYGQLFSSEESSTYDRWGDRFRLLMEFSPVGIFLYEPSLDITTINFRFVEILQTGKENLLNLNMRNIKDKSIMTAIQRPLEGKEGFYEGIYHSTLSNLSINILLKTAPVFNKAGEVVGVIGIVEDNTEREKTRKALYESEERLRLLINSTPDLICFKDEKERLLVANEAWQDFFQLRGKPFLGKDVNQLIELVPSMKAGLETTALSDRKVWGQNSSLKEEEVIVRPDGSKRIIDVVKVPLYFQDGSKRGLVVLGRDITQRKMVEELLRENEERFRLVAMHSNDIIYEWDPETNLMKWYGDCRVIMGKRKNPATLDDFLAVIHSEDRLKVIKAWENMLEAGTEWRDEFRLIRGDGMAVHFKGSGVVLFYEGKAKKYYGTLTNISHEKMLIQNLEEAIQMAENNQEQIRGLLKAIPDMIFMFDKEGYIRDYHAKSSGRLYTSPPNFLNRLVDDVLPPELARLTHEKTKAVLADKGIETYNYSLIIDGEKLVYESRMVYVDSQNVLAIVRDVTRALAVEKELIEAKEKAEESDRLKSAFLANMSHEIRTPMNGILGFSELLRTHDLSEEDKCNFTDVIISSGDQLLRIINDVLEVSRLETGQVELKADRVNLTAMMDDLERFFILEAQKKQIELIKVIPDQELFCRLDGGKLTQVFNNLIYNALKFTPTKGQVSFGFQEEKESILFFVKDNGIGIDPAHHRMIFDRFMQVPRAQENAVSGTGLGLSICKSLVELLGGRLWVESELNEGARFFFTLPL